MKAFQSAIDCPRWPRILIGSYICIYLLFGLYTELRLTIELPVPASLLQDFRYYQRALSNALQHADPYAERLLGPAYLYPPPALFLVELLSMRSFLLQVSLYSALNICLLALMVYGVSRHYGYSHKRTWYWYVLCFGVAPFLEVLHIGQINVITAFGIFMLFLWADTWPFVGGTGLSVATITKVSPVLFFGYLIASRKWRTLVTAILVIALVTALSALRYGLAPVLEYPSVLRWVTGQFPLDANAQSLVAKLAGLRGIVSHAPAQLKWLMPLMDVFVARYQVIQHVLALYIIGTIVISNLLFVVGKQEREPVFIVTSLGMMLVPNVMWYHHYVFVLLPLLIWMGWSRLDRRVVAWCLMGLLICQCDRWFPPYGLLIHVFGHISIVLVLAGQVRAFMRSRRLGVRPTTAAG